MSPAVVEELHPQYQYMQLILIITLFFFFFFQAEDGIRDFYSWRFYSSFHAYQCTSAFSYGLPGPGLEALWLCPCGHTHSHTADFGIGVVGRIRAGAARSQSCRSRRQHLVYGVVSRIFRPEFARPGGFGCNRLHSLGRFFLFEATALAVRGGIRACSAVQGNRHYYSGCTLCVGGNTQVTRGSSSIVLSTGGSLHLAAITSTAASRMVRLPLCAHGI